MTAEEWEHIKVRGGRRRRGGTVSVTAWLWRGEEHMEKSAKSTLKVRKKTRVFIGN